MEELPEEGGAVRASKWPKERKPKLTCGPSMRGMAIYRTGQVVYTAGDDAKDYYSQIDARDRVDLPARTHRPPLRRLVFA